jgi:hypothetical protein
VQPSAVVKLFAVNRWFNVNKMPFVAVNFGKRGKVNGHARRSHKQRRQRL